jgi:hypothetical protein
MGTRSGQHQAVPRSDALSHRLSGPDPGIAAATSWRALDLVHAGDAHYALALEWPATASPDVHAILALLREAFPGAGVVVGGSGMAALPAGPRELVGQAEQVLALHRRRTSGRLARFPGQDDVQGRLTVAGVLSASCIDEVIGLAGVTVTDTSLLDLTGFARPTWRDGHCTLVVQPGVQGLIPFEVRDQIPCCTAH